MDTDAPTDIPMTNGLLTLAQWLSPGYPLGSFAYSHGLEELVAAEQVKTEDDLLAWLETVLTDGAGASDALFISASARQEQPIPDLDSLALAFAGSQERRLETLSQGRAFAAVTSDVWGLDLEGQCFPVVFGEALTAMCLPLKDGIMLYLQGFVSNISSGAIRLGVTSQTGAQRIIQTLSDTIKQCTTDALDHDLSDLKSNAFLSDLAAIAHETRQPRIFRT